MKKIQSTLIVLGAFLLSTQSFALKEVTCSMPLFVGGPIKFSALLKNDQLEAKMECPSGNGKIKLPQFGQLDELLNKMNLIGPDEFIESMAVSLPDASAHCSQATSAPTLIGCSSQTALPLRLVVIHQKQGTSRPLELKSETFSFTVARQIYEQAAGKDIYSATQYLVGLALELTASDKTVYYPMVDQAFDGEDGCVN